MCRAAYLSVLAKPLVADDHILPQLQLFIGEESRADAAQVAQQAGQLLLRGPNNNAPVSMLLSPQLTV